MAPTIDFTGVIVFAIIILMIIGGGIGALTVGSSKPKFHETRQECEKELSRTKTCVAVWVEGE